MEVLTGGVVLSTKAKRFWAEETRRGWILSIIATALVETGSRMDNIFEEFKGTVIVKLF